MLVHRWVVAIGFMALTAHAANDRPGSQDHPKIPRIAGTYIAGYTATDYDEGRFVTGVENGAVQAVNVEGRRTSIIYEGPESISPLGALRNMQAAAKELGEVDEIYACKRGGCSRQVLNTAWSSGNRPAHPYAGWANFMLEYHNHKDPHYWYATVTADSTRYHVAVLSLVKTESLEKPGPLIFLHVIEEADFEPDLTVVSPQDITDGLVETGHFALYGVYFEFDSASLTEASNAALEATAKALADNPDMNIYVVGHTDNTGAFDYNVDLSMRRAQSVASALTGKFGIAAERLTPFGAGPAAPVATNRTEEGQALNRRVELVEN